jgi:uncharacterized damage-inducible protein DinB
MAITGKTGADAIAKSLKHICRVINAYAAKLNNVIDQAQAFGTITEEQAAIAKAFVSSADAACQVFILIATYSGFQP